MNKLTEDMSDVEIARWTALITALKIIYGYADKYGIEDVNLDTRKILKEYVDPISGDILYNIKKEKQKKYDTCAWK